MLKGILFDGSYTQSPADLEHRAKRLIRKASITEGAQVALISQNRRVAFAMLSALLEKGVNVQGVLLRGEKYFCREHVKAYTQPDHIRRTMQSMGSGGINYFIVMALDDVIQEPIVREFRGNLWNIHASLLPEYQGVGNPVREQLKQGDKYGGITLQYVGEEIDSGDVLVRYKVPLIYDDKPRELENPSRTLVDRNYTRVIIPTAAEVCAFAIGNIDRIQPMPVERLRSGSRLSPNKMIYARK